jgi:hypothetical protein
VDGGSADLAGDELWEQEQHESAEYTAHPQKMTLAGFLRSHAR